MEYNMISADGDVDSWYMPGDALTSRASCKWQDRVPQIMDTAEEPRWYADEIDLLSRPFGGLANLAPPKQGVSKRIDRMAEDLGSSPADVQRKITRDNAGKLYDLI